MQNGKREVGGFRGLRKPTKIKVSKIYRQNEIAGLKKYQVTVTFLAILLLSSCSHFKRDNRKSFELFKGGLSRLCFEGEGKGRIQLFQNKHLFRYESIDGGSSETWKMGVNIPARGEEVLELDYQDVFKDGVKVRGKFITLLKKEIKTRKRSAYYLKTLKRFISKLGLVLKIRRLGEKGELKNSLNCKSDSCFIKELKTALGFQVNKQKFSLTLPVDKESEFLLEGFNLESQKYRRLRGRIVSKEGHNKNFDGIGINLFFDSCLKL